MFVSALEPRVGDAWKVVGAVTLVGEVLRRRRAAARTSAVTAYRRSDRMSHRPVEVDVDADDRAQGNAERVRESLQHGDAGDDPAPLDPAQVRRAHVGLAGKSADRLAILHAQARQRGGVYLYRQHSVYYTYTPGHVKAQPAGRSEMGPEVRNDMAVS